MGVLALSQDVAAVAAHGLAGSCLDPPAGPLAAERWAALVATCRAYEMLGYLAGAVAADRLAVTSTQAAELASLEAECVATSRRVEQAVARLARSLSAAGIDFRVVDGPARARLAFADPGLRHVDGADVVVEPRYAGLAAAMTHHHHGRPPADREAGDVSRVRVRTTVLLPGTSATTVDLAGLGCRSTHMWLGEQSVAALPLEEQLVSAGLEVATALGARQLARLRDVAELVLARGLDVARVHRLAEGWGVADPVAAAIRAAWQAFGLADQTALSVWARRVQPSDIGGRRGRRRQAGRGPGPGVAAAVGRLLGRLRPGVRPVPGPIEVAQ